MQLIYRAQTYSYVLQPAAAVATPQTVNWRYQVPGQAYGGKIAPKREILPKAINWRYQMA